MMDGGRAGRYKGRVCCFEQALERFMRVFVGTVLAASLLANGAFAQALAPGRPAGVQQARMTSQTTALMIGTGAVIMAGVGILISGTTSALSSQVIGSQNNIVAPPVSTVVSTSTTS
jgi:hypothetical protein